MIILKLLCIFTAGLLIINLIVYFAGLIGFIITRQHITVYFSHPFYLIISLLYQIGWWANYFNILTF